MESLPPWAIILAAGVSFGFGAGGAWIALGYRIKAQSDRLKALEEWREEIERARIAAQARDAALREEVRGLRQDMYGVNNDNGMRALVKDMSRDRHDFAAWIQQASNKLNIPFTRKPR